MILVGDIGGTKVNFALYDHYDSVDNLKVVTSSQYASKDYDRFSLVIEQFLETLPNVKIDAACFGIAGPVIDGRCITTNLPWDVKTSDLQEQLGISKVKLLNDLEATAYGMLYLDESEFINLNPDAKNQKGNIAVIAAGTGLGEAILYFDGNEYSPIATEGGHSDFAPNCSIEDELLIWLRNRFPEHVSYERVVSGIGIYTIYEFLLGKGFASEPKEMLEIDLSSDKSAMISKLALEHNDPLCFETLRIFAQIYGAEAGNLALKCMSVGGVYIGGGIAPKILPMITSEHFLNAFFKKGRFEKLLENMTLKVSLNDKTAVLGCVMYIKDKLLKYNT